MRIAMLTLGSRGDVQPFVALGMALHSRGHSVTVIAVRDFAMWIEAQGLRYAPIDLQLQALSQGPLGQGWISSGRSPLTAIRRVVPVVRALARATREDGWRGAQGADCLLYNVTTTAMAGPHIAEALQIPSLQVSLQPLFARTAAFTQPMSPAPALPQGVIAAAYNRLTYLINRQIAWLPVASETNRWRQNVLGLPGLGWRGPFPDLDRRQIPVLHAYSRHIVPRPADWHRWHHITGYWRLPVQEFQPDAALAAFLQAGAPPVVAGFGSMSEGEASALTEQVIKAVVDSGNRGIFITGWGGLQAAPTAPEIFSVGDVPHSWLYPQAAAIIHHGGAGTLGAAAAAGRPSVVVPFFADQFFWARRAHAVGIAPRPFPRSALTVAKLTEAVAAALPPSPIHERAAHLGRQIQQEDGVRAAVDLIEQGTL